MPRDASRAATVFGRVLDKLDPAGGVVRGLVVVPSIDDAISLAKALREQRGAQAGARTPLVPLTSVRRARRLLGTERPTAVAGTSKDLATLLEQSGLKVDGITNVMLLWVDELARSAAQSGIEALLAEVPKESERLATATAVDSAVEEFVQRFMWRARRVAHDTNPASPIPVQYALASPATRGDVLRSLLDVMDPETALIATFTDAGEASAREALSVLGYGDDRMVRVQRDAVDQDAALIVLFDEPPTPDAVRQAAAHAPNVVALIAPSRVGYLRELTGNGASPLQVSSAFQAARAAEDVLRDELRSVIRGGATAPQVLQLETLCADHDPVDVAAAAIFLLQRERMRARKAEAAPAPHAPRAAPVPPITSGFLRVYLNVGGRDGASRGDVVGAITGEAGVSGSQIGKVDLRDTHTVVEVSSDVAPRVIAKLSNAMIRGRRLVVREDRERDAPKSGRGASAARSGGRTKRDSRPREDSHRGRRTDTGESAGRLPRAIRESDEWAERASRLRSARGGATDGGEPKR